MYKCKSQKKDIVYLRNKRTELSNFRGEEKRYRSGELGEYTSDTKDAAKDGEQTPKQRLPCKGGQGL